MDEQLQLPLDDVRPPARPQKYVKRPIPIEALQLRWDTWSQVCDFLGEDMFTQGAEGCFVWPGESPDEERYGASPITADKPLFGDVDAWEIGCRIPTLEGVMLARQGDYIIKGIHGEYYPCKQSIFEESYEVYTAP